MAKINILKIISPKEKIAIDKYIHKNYNIDILQADIDFELMKKINKEFNDKYDYIQFEDESNFEIKLKNYLPLNNITNKRIFVNELLINPIIMSNIDIISDDRSINYMAVLLKHIIKNNVEEKTFYFNKECEKIRKINSCSFLDISIFKRNIFNLVEKHYSQDNIIRYIKYRRNKNKILKVFVFKLVQNIQNDIKKTPIIFN